MKVKINYKGVSVEGTPEAIVSMMATFSWDGFPSNEEYREKVMARLSHIGKAELYADSDLGFLKMLDSINEIKILRG